MTEPTENPEQQTDNTKDIIKEIALCPECLEPIDPLVYYCEKCGNASAQVTPYIPYVNIKYNYSIFGRLWRKVWYEESGLLMKVVSLSVIVTIAPIMLVGLPFVVWDKLVNDKESNETDSK